MLTRVAGAAAVVLLMAALVLVAEPLDAHAGPFKLVVSEDKRPARSVRNLVSIELKEPN